METRNKSNHAKLFDIRGLQVLAYLDHDENQDNLLVLRFRLWSDAVAGPVEFGASINSEEPLSEETVELWERNTLSAFDGLDEAKVESVCEKMGVFSLVATLEGKAA